MIVGRDGKFRMYLMLAVCAICTCVGLYNLYVENDLFAVMNFILAGVAFALYIRNKRMIESETTWRSYR